jgi:hypothetical protein
MVSTTESPEAAANAIYAYWIDPNGQNPPSDELVVIRADVVELLYENESVEEARTDRTCDFNLIVPVDAQNQEMLVNVYEYLRTYGQVIFASVTDHSPEAPYVSNGYMSESEQKLGMEAYKIKPAETPGLSRKSPGDNPWG